MSQDDRNVERSRITLLAGGLALALTLATRRESRAAPTPFPEVMVYKTPT